MVTINIKKHHEKLTNILNLDIDECVTETDSCHEYAVCSNNVGSFSCSCNVGYSGNGTICQTETILVVYTKDVFKPVLLDVSG